MLSNIWDRLSSLSLLLVMVLLPVFFLPFTKIPIDASKGFLLVIGLVFSIIFWTIARFSDGKVTLPKSWLLFSGLVVILSFFLSAFFSTASQMSFFGIMFDTGTFWFIFAVFILMFVCSVILKREEKAKAVLFWVMTSSAILLIFQTFHLFMPKLLSLGVLTAKSDNILGSWNAFGLFSGFFAVMSLFVIEFFSISRLKKILLGILLALSVFLVVAVNSTLTWSLLGVFSLVIFIYKISFSFSVQHHDQAAEQDPSVPVPNLDKKHVNFPLASFFLIVVSLLFLMSGLYVEGWLPSKLGLSNVEVSPSFSATMIVAKADIMKHPVLGIGPNRFGDAWAMFKPQGINSSIFWDTHFDFGSGLLPTLFATTGILGILSLLVFFFLFLVTGARSLFLSAKTGMSKVMPAFFLASLYLFVASFFYPTGPAIFTLAFAFAGVFIGLFNSNLLNGETTILFSNNPRKSFVSLFVLVCLMLASFIAGFKYIERLISVPYFSNTLNATATANNTAIDIAEANIIKANLFYQNDLYLRTYAQVYLAKLNSLVSQGSALPEAKKPDLQASLDQAQKALTLAIAYNKENYLNFQMLGAVYNNVASLGVANAYDQALEAYKQASLLNPLNPGLKLALATVSFANGKTKDAQDYANAALTLKPDYVDALIVLAQMAKSGGNNSEALSFAQRALDLSPQDKNLIQFVNSLKNPSASTSSDTTKSTPKKSGTN